MPPLLAQVDELRVDFYAGALAMFAIVLFAKFATHKASSPTWRALHFVCVGCAWAGAVICLTVLGWGEPEWDEETWRKSVVVLAGIAATILAVDVWRKG